jgi:hypothetical protein
MNILHLSDLHFGSRTAATNWHSQLADDLTYELECKTLDLLIISGDVGNYSTPREYAAAEQFVKSVCQDFQLSSHQIVVVPGNHDVNWALAKRAYTPKRREDYKGLTNEAGRPDPSLNIDRGELVEIQNPIKYRKRFNHFSSFYEAITGQSYPSEYDQQAIIYHYPEYNLLILGLNSAWQLDHYYKARAGINSDALSNALTTIRKHPEIYLQCLKLAVWHHPISSSGEDRITDSSFLQRLAQAGFVIGLHGHIHKAETSLFRYDMSIGGRKVEIISAGTFGAPVREWTSGYPLQYNLIRSQGKNLVVETRARRELNGAWKPDAIWTQGPGVDPLPRYEIAFPAVTAIRDAQTLAAPIATEMPPPLVQDNPTKTIDTDAVPHPSNEASVPVKRILIIAVCPTDVSYLRLDKEVRDICNVLWKAKKVRFVIEVRWAVRVKDLGRAILEFEPHIIHFCGHGSEEGGIVLEDEMGQSHKVSPQALAGLFELFTDSIEGVVESVFLNACYMENQADALSPYVRYIIGTKSAVTDVDAINISAAFYEALANGRSYEFAYEYALKIAKAQGTVADISSVMRKNEQAGGTQAKRDRDDEHKNKVFGTRVLFLAASPSNAGRLRLDKEYREISDVLREAIQQSEILIQQRWGARFEDLHQSLFDFKPHIVHFTGHGMHDGLLFDDEKGEGQVIGAELLCKLFDLFSNRIDCVVLNASYSDLIAKELSEKVGCVIGLSGLVGDEAGIAFAIGFYRALAAKLSFEDAFKSGCVQVLMRTKNQGAHYTFRKAENSR